MMRLTIIALILAIAALGLGSFATFNSLDSDGATPVVAEATWSEAECARLRDARDGLPRVKCEVGDSCMAYLDLTEAINDNCE